MWLYILGIRDMKKKNVYPGSGIEVGDYLKKSWALGW